MVREQSKAARLPLGPSPAERQSAEDSSGSPSALSPANFGPELVLLVLQHLDHVGLSRGLPVCRTWRGVGHRFAAELWGIVLQQAHIEPYFDRALGSPGPEAFQRSSQLAAAWRKAPAAGATLLPMEHYVRSVRVDFQRQLLVAGMSLGQVQCASWAGGRRQFSPVFADVHPNQVLAVDFSVEADTCVSGSGEPSYNRRHVEMRPGTCVIKVHTLSTGACRRTLEGHRDSVNALRLTTLAAELAISASSDSTLAVWDLRTGARLRKLEGHTAPVYCLSDVRGDVVLSAGHDRSVREWDWRLGTCLRVVLETARPISAMHVDRRSGTIAIGEVTGGVHLFGRPAPGGAGDVEPGRLARLCSAGHLHGRGPPPEVVSVQHDGDKVVSVARNGQLRMFTRQAAPPALNARWTLQNLRMYVSSVAFDGATLVSDGFDNCVALFHIGAEDTTG